MGCEEEERPSLLREGTGPARASTLWTKEYEVIGPGGWLRSKSRKALKILRGEKARVLSVFPNLIKI